MPWTYILRCSDGAYYVGSTWDLDARLHDHAIGKGAKFTSRRLPVEVVFAQEFDSIGEAWAMERRVHGWSRAKKEALIAGRADLLPSLSKSSPPGERNTETPRQ